MAFLNSSLIKVLVTLGVPPQFWKFRKTCISQVNLLVKKTDKAECNKSSLMPKPKNNFYGRHCLQKYDSYYFKKSVIFFIIKPVLT